MLFAGVGDGGSLPHLNESANVDQEKSRTGTRTDTADVVVADDTARRNSALDFSISSLGGIVAGERWACHDA